MKISNILNDGKLHLSFEVFPPKTGTAFESVKTATEEIAKLRPSFMSVTYGAGGGTSRYTLDIAENIKKGDTLQTAASKPHGGISLYRDILANVLSTDKDTTSIPENQTENQDVAESVVVDENVTPEEKEGRVR